MRKPDLTAAARMRRYRSRKTFERAIQWCLTCGVEVQELEDLVSFVASGVKMRFHHKGRPKGKVTAKRYISPEPIAEPVTAIPVTHSTKFEPDLSPMDLISEKVSEGTRVAERPN